jgi:magnesium chelatase subunit D
LLLICKVCQEFEVEGHRPDPMIAKTAAGLAAISGRKKIIKDDIKKAVKLILPFRTRKLLLRTQEKKEEIYGDIIDKVSKEIPNPKV